MAFAVLLSIIGCQTQLIEDTADGARYLYGTTRTRSSGLARVCIDVEEGDTALMLTAEAESPAEVFIRKLTDPAGVDVLVASDFVDSDESKTNAVFVNGVSSLNWPIDDADPSLVPGCWRVEIGVVDQELEFVDEPANVDVLIKADDDFSAGTLEVALIYTDGLRDDDEVVDAVSEATSRWQTLYEQAGIDITFSSFVLDEDGLLPPAFGEEDRIRVAAADTPARTINLLLSDSVEITGEEVLGIAGDIPGPLVPTAYSAVQLSMIMAAGGDGVFDSMDIRLLSETMAHETAHFLGLFHPVERASWSRWDALEDTPRCGSERACESQLGSNLMFPYPVCMLNTCEAQFELTEDQRGVLNRAVAVR